MPTVFPKRSAPSQLFIRDHPCSFHTDVLSREAGAKDLAPASRLARVSAGRPPSDLKSEERLIPMIRARLAERLVK